MARSFNSNFVSANTQGFLNFRDAPYYAIADGYTDNRAALQSIINDAREQGKAVYIPSGEYVARKQFTAQQVIYIGEM